MAELPFSTSKPLPKDVASAASHDRTEPRLGPTLAADRPDDRLVARNDVPTIVCMPQQVFPSIEYGAAQFQNIRAIENDKTIDEIAAALDTVMTRFEPQFGPNEYYYSLRKHAIQLSSNTLGRFLDDLRTIDSVVADIQMQRRNPLL